MEDEHQLACIRVLQTMTLHCLMARPPLALLNILTAVKITLKYGLSAMSAPIFATYGMFCLSVMNQIDDGLRFGRLGLTLLERFGSIEYLPRVYAAYYGVIGPCVDAIDHSLEPLKKAYR